MGPAAARTVNWNSRPSEGFYYYPNSAWYNPLFIGGYNFETPSLNLRVAAPGRVGNAKLEIYDYPGEYQKVAEGESLVRLRMEEEEWPHLVADGDKRAAAVEL